MATRETNGVILQPGGLAGRPLVFGEVLFDEFQDGSAVIGGAPFNVAWHLRGFGLDPLMISRAGEDALGAEVLARMQAHRLDTRGIQRDAAHPTGRVRVSLMNGEPLYSILPEQAYDFIDSAALPDSLSDLGSRSDADGAFALLYHGSLAARRPVSARTLEALRESALPIFIDINLRRPWWERKAVEHLLAGGRWLKLNHHELAELAELPGTGTGALLEGAASLCNRYGLQTVIVTRGEAGAVAVTADGSVVGKPEPAAGITDQVGAGDAFSAVTLLGILRGWSLDTTLSRASAFAAAICSVRGAIPADAALYERFLASWQR